MFLRAILAAIQEFSGRPDAKLTGKQIAIGFVCVTVVMAVLRLILPDSLRQLLRLIDFVF